MAPREWNISKVEWDGFTASALARAWGTAWGVAIGAGLLGVASMVVGVLLHRNGSTALGLLFAAGGGGLGLACLWLPRRLERARDEWRQLYPVVWETRGCVCPACRVRVDSSPCPRHGLGATDQPMLAEYWEAIAVWDEPRIEAASRALFEGPEARACATPRAAKGISGRIGGFGASLLFRAWAAGARFAVSESDAALARRRVRALWIAGGIVGATVAASLMIGSFRPVHVLVGCLIPLSGLLAIALFPTTSRARPFCARCGQDCADPRPKVCPECGAALNRAFAVRRARAHPRRVLGFVAVCFGLIYLPSLLFKSVGHLPPRAQIALAGADFPMENLFQRLDPRTLSAEETRLAAELLIDWCRPGRKAWIPDSNFIETAIRAGALPSEYRETAARANAEATLAVAQEGGAVVATVTTRFGRPVFGIAQAVRLVFGGASIDGGAWTAGADWPLSRDDLEATSRRMRDDPLPESQLTFTARLEGVAPGTHTVRARCWIVVGGPSWRPYTPAFDANGALVPPTDALGFYPLDLEATITVD